ncbi:MAG: hypothetical protein FJ390_00175 [Verrucomicrobia bacterium]|nr:hypothetical protein [Verrucomicrobiota bacterium]
MLQKIPLTFFFLLLLLRSAVGMLQLGAYGKYLAHKILEKNSRTTTAQQETYTEQADSSCLDPRSDIASCPEHDLMRDDHPTDNMDLSASPSVPAITIEDCRAALKKYPNDHRLVLQQNRTTGKISFVGNPGGTVVFHSINEAQQNKLALQAVKNLISQCVQFYGKPSTNYVNYHPHLLYLMNVGLPLDSETLRKVLFHTTGTIHGAEGDYEYQACLADPTRNAIEDLPEGYIPPHQIIQAFEAGAANAVTALTKTSTASPAERLPFAKLGNNKSYGSITPPEN